MPRRPLHSDTRGYLTLDPSPLHSPLPLFITGPSTCHVVFTSAHAPTMEVGKRLLRQWIWWCVELSAPLVSQYSVKMNYMFYEKKRQDVKMPLMRQR